VKLTWRLPLLAALLCASCATPQQPKTIVAPPAARIAALLDFAGPVSLTCHVATAEELAHPEPKGWGVPIASFSYADPQHSSDTIIIKIFPAGSFLGEGREKIITMLTNQPKEFQKYGGMGAFRASGGRTIYQIPLLIGMGGGMSGTLLQCRDPRYELVVLQDVDAHDGKDPKLFTNHLRPRRQVLEVIEAIESLVFR
jgi:hypothetical protein